MRRRAMITVLAGAAAQPLAARAQLPSIPGGLISYGPNLAEAQPFNETSTWHSSA
jgi:hypothetical protein